MVCAPPVLPKSSGYFVTAGQAHIQPAPIGEDLAGLSQTTLPEAPTGVSQTTLPRADALSHTPTGAVSGDQVGSLREATHAHIPAEPRDGTGKLFCC